MKCIGVNQWTGIDPATAEMMAELGQWAKQSQKAEQERLSRMPPSERFLGLANERFHRPKIFGIAPVEGYWQIGDWTLAEIRRIVLDDAKDAGKFLIHLQSLYVVDSARGKGEGKRSIEQIKQIVAGKRAKNEKAGTFETEDYYEDLLKGMLKNLEERFTEYDNKKQEQLE